MNISFGCNILFVIVFTCAYAVIAVLITVFLGSWLDDGGQFGEILVLFG
jgi:hypothetical protein